MFREWTFVAVFGFGVAVGGRPVPGAGPPSYKGGKGEEGYGEGREGRDNTVLPGLGVALLS